MLKKLTVSIFLTFVLSYPVCLSAVDSKTEPVQDVTVKIGVLAQQGPGRCHSKWDSTASYLSEKVAGYSFEILPLNYKQLYPAVADGEVDFVITTPSIYVELEVLYQAVRIATMKNKYQSGDYTFLGGVLFCRQDREDLKNITDLKGKSLMGLHEHACTAWHAVRLELLENDIEPYRDFVNIKFGATGASVVQAVRSGEVDVGAMRSDGYERMKIAGIIKPDEFKILHEKIDSHPDVPFAHSTHIFPEKPFAKVRQTPNQLAEKVATALIDMPADSPAAKLSQSSGWTIPHNYQPVHDCLRKLRLRPYENYGKVTLAGIFAQYKPWIITIALLVVLISFSAGSILLLKSRLVKAEKVILEHQIMEISDSAYRKFSQSLHDGLGQQLTGIKFMIETLKDKLANESSKCSQDAQKISELVRGTINQSRDLAKGLDPVELSENDLFSATEVLLRNIENTFNIKCNLDYDHSVKFKSNSEAVHLYRIIQEAINNGINHGKAREIYVSLRDVENEYVLTIENDGLDLPKEEIRGNGMGFHIMKYRASAINAVIEVNNRDGGGVVVKCSLPRGV